MAKITIGNYYPEKSIIHSLDPRVKLFSTLIWVVLLFLINNFMAYGLLTVYFFSVVKASKIPFGKLLKGLKGIIFILLFSIIVNVLFTKGHPIISAGYFFVSKEGLIKGSYMAIRLIYLVLGTSIMTLTTKPNDLADGLEKSLGFLKGIKIPVHEIAMIISLALRFIPILMEETEKIIKAQKARGADFESGNIFKKAKSLIPILIPLFVSSIRRALDLAAAMESRCYQGGNRTKMKPLKYEIRDITAYAVNALLVVAVIVMNVVAAKGFWWMLYYK